MVTLCPEKLASLVTLGSTLETLPLPVPPSIIIGLGNFIVMMVPI